MRGLNLVLKNCVVCGKEFDAKGNSKTCSKKCSKERRVKKHYRYHINPEPQKKASRKWREKHPHYLRDYYRKRKRKFVNMLGGKCEICGYSKCLSALEFHHIDSNEKEGRKEWQKKKFEQKIRDGKIMLLCSNCHRENHNDF